MDSFNTRTTLEVNDKRYQIHSLQHLNDGDCARRLPYCLKVLLENLLRNENGIDVTAEQISAVINWQPGNNQETEIAFSPARVLMQDFTGVPAVVDLASMRDAMAEQGGNPAAINPGVPVDLVIDHSVMVDHFGSKNALDLNAVLEYRRNSERYSFLKWGQSAFDNFRVVPPSTGIVHQVNLEYLADIVCEAKPGGVLSAYPDTVVGTDSHTTMINGIGVLGWGVGGIEAEAAMLGQSIAMLLPKVVGFKLHGELPEGATATDLVLSIVEILRAHGVVGKFVEFYGQGLNSLSVSDQATISNMAPEYGATCGVFPIDVNTLEYLRLTGRSEQQIALVEAYARHQSMFRDPAIESESQYDETLELDLSTIEPCIAGPKRPQDRVLLRNSANEVRTYIKDRKGEGTPPHETDRTTPIDGDIVVAAITSCTNTSNPDVIIGAGLLARKAVELGLNTKPWVKTSLAPGSQVVTEYLEQSNLLEPLEELGFSVVGYGCTTCIGNSGPLPDAVAEAIKKDDLIVCSVLSGNRNFEGRVHAAVKMNFLASPPLVVAYALAGSMQKNLFEDPLGSDRDGNPVYLKDIWPTTKEIREVVDSVVTVDMFKSKYADVFRGDSNWAEIPLTPSGLFHWESESTYIRRPTFFDTVPKRETEFPEITGARALVMLGDSITTDHISPAGAIMPDSPAGAYLIERGIARGDFNSYGSRRGNHEIMVRGTFANVRLRNEIAAGTEGGWTLHQPSGELMTIYDAAEQYQEENVPLIVIAGKEYGSGSSRDWAAKGPLLLGVKAVIVESFERIHRSNLVGMGILPLQFKAGENRQTLELTGSEKFDIRGLARGCDEVEVVAMRTDRSVITFNAIVRIDTPREWDYYAAKGILQYVLNQLVESELTQASA